MYSKLEYFNDLIEKFSSTPNLNFTPSFLIKSISFSIASCGSRNFGRTLLTIPPADFSFSKTVTSIPTLVRKYAADRPEGPAPMIAAFIFLCSGR